MRLKYKRIGVKNVLVVPEIVAFGIVSTMILIRYGLKEKSIAQAT